MHYFHVQNPQIGLPAVELEQRIMIGTKPPGQAFSGNGLVGHATESHSIYGDKHNAATDQTGNTEVGARRNEQQQRIANGVRSGQLTPSETARAENREQNINQHVAADRSAIARLGAGAFAEPAKPPRGGDLAAER